jgi:hypothetical protein
MSSITSASSESGPSEPPSIRNILDYDQRSLAPGGTGVTEGEAIDLTGDDEDDVDDQVPGPSSRRSITTSNIYPALPHFDEGKLRPRVDALGGDDGLDGDRGDNRAEVEDQDEGSEQEEEELEEEEEQRVDAADVSRTTTPYNRPRFNDTRHRPPPRRPVLRISPPAREYSWEISSSARGSNSPSSRSTSSSSSSRSRRQRKPSTNLRSARGKLEEKRRHGERVQDIATRVQNTVTRVLEQDPQRKYRMLETFGGTTLVDSRAIEAKFKLGKYNSRPLMTLRLVQAEAHA